MSETSTAAAKPPRKKKGESGPVPVPALSLDVKKMVIKVGRSDLSPRAAREYASTLVTLAETVEKLSSLDANKANEVLLTPVA